jgi:hypothetical protein
MDGSSLKNAARLSAAIELGRRHPYLTLCARFIVPLVVLVAAVAVVVIAWRSEVQVPSFNLWWLAAAAGMAALGWAVWALGQRSDLWWKLRYRLRRY